MILSKFLRLVLTNSSYFVCETYVDINFTHGLLPSRIHVIWRDSVDVGSSRLGLKSESVGYFSLSVCYAILMSYNNSETAVYGYNPALF